MHRISRVLAALPLLPGADAMPRNLRLCYTMLVEQGMVGEGEMPLLEDWLADVTGLAHV
jgi:hypothetical protein